MPLGNKAQCGLSDLVSGYLGFVMDKSLQCSTWEKSLSYDQKGYAALDTYFLILFYIDPEYFVWADKDKDIATSYKIKDIATDKNMFDGFEISSGSCQKKSDSFQTSSSQVQTRWIPVASSSSGDWIDNFDNNVTGYSLFNEPEPVEPELPNVYSNLLTKVVSAEDFETSEISEDENETEVQPSTSKSTITLGEYRKRKHEEITSNAKKYESTSRILFTNDLPYAIDLHIMSADGKSYDCSQNEFVQVFINPLFSDLMGNVIKWQIIRKHHCHIKYKIVYKEQILVKFTNTVHRDKIQEVISKINRETDYYFKDIPIEIGVTYILLFFYYSY